MGFSKLILWVLDTDLVWNESTERGGGNPHKRRSAREVNEKEMVKQNFKIEKRNKNTMSIFRQRGKSTKN